jgi:hypothetical protein
MKVVAAKSSKDHGTSLESMKDGRQAQSASSSITIAESGFFNPSRIEK